MSTTTRTARTIRRRIATGVAALAVTAGALVGLAPRANATVFSGNGSAANRVQCGSGSGGATVSVWARGITSGNTTLPVYAFRMRLDTDTSSWHAVGAGWTLVPQDGRGLVTFVPQSDTTFTAFAVFYAFATPQGGWDLKWEWAGGGAAPGLYTSNVGDYGPTDVGTHVWCTVF